MKEFVSSTTTVPVSLQEQGLMKAVANNETTVNVKLEKDDFVIVGQNVDITKDGIMKILNSIDEYQIDTQLIELTNEKAIVKAIVEIPKRKASGLGVSTSDEVEKRRKENSRELHDMLALAETRAIKRAVEMAVGTAIINQMARELFGSDFEVKEDNVERKNEDEMISNFKKANSKIFNELYASGFEEFNNFKEFYNNSVKFVKELLENKEIDMKTIHNIKMKVLGTDKQIEKMRPKEVLKVLEEILVEVSGEQFEN